ncbi:MAG: hypothetical protein U9P63_01460 [Patescibacteria group bacterium]|nr:hypothetical protein [Patescibacteria group bacterium]
MFTVSINFDLNILIFIISFSHSTMSFLMKKQGLPLKPKGSPCKGKEETKGTMAEIEEGME